MSIKSWFGENFGGPESICKNMLKIYNKHITSGHTKDEALAHALVTRYTLIRTIKSPEFDAILYECPDLGTLSLICLLAEQPHRGGKNIIDSMDRIRE